MGGYAWVTLATNNSYSLGALVLGHSLKKSNTAHKLVVLITSAVSESMRNQLATVFDLVKLVDVLDSKDEAHLALMQRPELGVTFTKIHCWRLIEFEKCVFLDADTLVVRNCDELFEREEFSAAPDASWPDCFNSGVFVFRPSIDTFNKILEFAVENKSFDGGDQGLLNQFFSNWASEDIKKHLPFVYNLTSIGSYAYIPAFKYYGSEARIVHFIGTGKPWLHQLNVATKTVTPSSGYEHLAPLLQQWWDLFCEKVHPNLDKNLESSKEGMSHSHVEACSNSLPVALTDVPQTFPCTPLRETIVTEHNISLKTSYSSGESPKPRVIVVVTPERIEERSKEKTEEKKIEKEPQEPQEPQESQESQEPQEPQEEPPPKDPFDYESFFPDETCIKSYLEKNVVTYQPFESQEEVKPSEEPQLLPRFLTLPEDDRRQSGNFDPELTSPPQREPTPEKEIKTIQKEQEKIKEPPRGDILTKSKSMPYLPLDMKRAEPSRSIWKSQPNVNIDPNRKYSMPKLKPIVPKQTTKPVWTKIPKVTHYTEFLMSSEYKDPVNLPKDRIGFVATELHKQKNKRNKPNVRTKFGPLPFVSSPEIENPTCKKLRLEHSDDDLYDLTQCRRQSGNKPKPKEIQKKQNGHNLEEILKRLKEFSKDYLHYFGVIPKPRRRTVMYRNAAVQTGGERECRTSEAFKTVRTAVCCWSRGTQTTPRREEFRLFRNYVKDQNETSQKGLLMISGKAKIAGDTGNDDVCSRDGYESLGEPRSEEKELVHHKNEFNFEGGRRDDVAKLHSNGALWKLEKDGVRVQTPFAGNKRKLPHRQLDSVENQTKSPLDDVKKPSRASFNLGKSPKSSKRSPEVGLSNFRNEEKLVIHSKSDSKEKETGDDVTKDDISLKSQRSESSLDGSGVEDAELQNLVLLSRSDKTGGGDDAITRNIGKEKSMESNKVGDNGRSQKVRGRRSEIKEIVVHSKNQPTTGVQTASDVAKTEINSISLKLEKLNLKEGDTGVETSRPQSFYSEGADDLILNSESGLVVQEIHKADVESQSQRPETLSRVAIEENLQKDPNFDVIKAQNNTVRTTQQTLQEVESQTSPRVQNNHFETENSIVQFKNQPKRRGEENQVVDDTKIHKDEGEDTAHPENQSRLIENLAYYPEVSTLSRKNEELVVQSENLEENRQNCDVSCAVFSPKSLQNELREDGASVGLADMQNPVLHSNQTDIAEAGDDVTVTNGVSSEQKLSTSNEDGSKVQNLTAESEEEPVTDFHPVTDVTNGFLPGTSMLSCSVEQKVTKNDTQAKDDVMNAPPKSSPPVNQNGISSRKTGNKPRDILCVTDFETPRSSRVTAKAEGSETTTTTPKPRKCRSGPKKVQERLSKDSPDESVRFSLTSTKDKPESGKEMKTASGIAGAIAQLSLQAGSEETADSAAASAAHQEYIRRQNWESGNIDYMGRDSFDNIWSKICQTLESKEQEPQTTGKTTEANVPEYIETLPGKPAPGPVEDDEIIFSKTDSRQSGLMNISEEEEVGGEGVKLSDILGGGGAKAESQPLVTSGSPDVVFGSKIEPLVLSPDAKAQPVMKTEPGAVESGVPEVKSVGLSTPLEIKPQTIEGKLQSEEKSEPSGGEVKFQPETTETKPGIAAVDIKSQTPKMEAKPSAVSTETKAQPSGAEAKVPATPYCSAMEERSGSAATEVQPEDTKSKPLPKTIEAEPKTEVIPQPTVKDDIKSGSKVTDVKPGPATTEAKPESTTEVKLQTTATDAKPQPGVAETLPQSNIPDTRHGSGATGAEAAPQIIAAEIKPSSVETKTQPTASLPDQTQPQSPTTPAGECKVVAIPSPPIIPPTTHPKIRQSQPERLQVQSEPIPLPPPDSPSSEQPPKMDASKEDGKQKKGVFTKILEMVGVKEKNGNDGGKSVFYDAEGSGEKREQETVQPSDPQSIQVAETKRKSPSPKLTMPLKPETAVTTPTPPPIEEIPQRKNSGLLKVEETILETPPVPEPSNIQTEIEDIIGKAKTEVETLLKEKETVNTMKLIMGEEQEEVEELKVTSEEERKRHKGEIVTSKLSDQILKAIPPPRRKAISDATASTSAIPKDSNEQQKSPTAAEGKTKSSKPSSIPVPPPRNKGKPQPPPSKGKGKK